jgi:phosphoribosyl 1,2-cyclic phosphodiesterase
MTLRLRVLGSGSTGNATLIEGDGCRILIDAGLGPRQLAERLESAGVDPASLAGILISHEHHDHARGAASFSAKWGVRLMGSRGTYAAAGFGATDIAGYDVLEPGVRRYVGAFDVRPLAVSHDAAGPLAFVVALGDQAVGHATDLGRIDGSLVAAFAACDAVLIESNYDPALLRDGPYPFMLKERIVSGHGHLSNGDVGRFLESGLSARCRSVVLAHLSQKNNHPELVRMNAEQALARCGRTDVQLELCTSEGTGWVEAHAAPMPTVPAPTVPTPARSTSGARQLALF